MTRARTGTVSLLFLTCMVVPLSQAHAASERYELIWTIDPVPIEPLEKMFRPGDVVAEARLLPVSLVTIDAEVVASDGRIVTAAGTQLAVLHSRLRTACSFTYKPRTAVQRLVVGDRGFVCLVDEDGDGRFESTFSVMNSTLGIPLSQGRMPGVRTPVRPVGYREIPVWEAKGTPQLFYKYSHQDKITGHAYFGVCVRSSETKNEPCFDGYSGVRSDKIPKEIGVAGVRAVATAKSGEDVTLAVKQGFARQPFTAMVYRTWVFY